MKAVDRISAKLSSWVAARRGFWRLDSMVGTRTRLGGVDSRRLRRLRRVFVVGLHVGTFF